MGKENGMNKLRTMGSMVLCVMALFWAGCAGGPDKKSTGEMIDDAAIHTKVTAALINDPVVSTRSIDVDVNRGNVTLSGAVNGEVVKKKAEDIVRGIEGVRSVKNNLIVRE
jgi:osmotically-inducible protein OsmY